MITALKLFGTGQITLPKEWRERTKTEHFMAQETPEGLLIKPLVEDHYYELEDGSFGLHFTFGISAKELAKKLEKENGKI